MRHALMLITLAVASLCADEALAQTGQLAEPTQGGKVI